MVKIRYEDQCVGCPQGCIHCGRRNAPIPEFYCDICGEQAEFLFDTDDGQVCEECLPRLFTEINEENYDMFE